MVGLPIIKTTNDICESCVVGKQYGDSFPKQNNKRASSLARLIHADIWGPMQTLSLSLSDNRYFVVFVDDFSRMTWVYFVKEKLEVLEVFKKFK